MATDKQNNLPDIEIPKEIAKGNYVNLAVVSHSQHEFIMDFISMLPGMPSAIVADRIITSPQTAKQIMVTLIQNIQKYEDNFGEIELENQTKDIPMGFGNPNAQA